MQEQIAVDVSPTGQPLRFIWKSRRYSVQIMDTWRYGGRWWRGEGPRDCYLVQAGALTAELHQQGGVWWLARLQD